MCSPLNQYRVGFLYFQWVIQEQSPLSHLPVTCSNRGGCEALAERYYPCTFCDTVTVQGSGDIHLLRHLIVFAL